MRTVLTLLAVVVCLGWMTDVAFGEYDPIDLSPEAQARNAEVAAQLRQARALERQAVAMQPFRFEEKPWYQSDGVLIGGAMLVVGVIATVVLRQAVVATRRKTP